MGQCSPRRVSRSDAAGGELQVGHTRGSKLKGAVCVVFRVEPSSCKRRKATKRGCVKDLFLSASTGLTLGGCFWWGQDCGGYRLVMCDVIYFCNFGKVGVRWGIRTCGEASTGRLAPKPSCSIHECPTNCLLHQDPPQPCGGWNLHYKSYNLIPVIRENCNDS